MELRLFETWKNPDFANFANELRKAYQIKGASVPLTVMGDWYMVGFSLSGNYSQQIITQAETCLRQGCQDVLDTLGPTAIAARIRQEIEANAPQGWEHYPAGSSPAATGDAHARVIVSYFHGNEDCPVCVQIEEVTRRVLETRFQDALQGGSVIFRCINAEDPANRVLIEKYQLTARAVIISQMAQGEEHQWKRLEKVWELLGEEQAFDEYVQTEIQNYLQANQ